MTEQEYKVHENRIRRASERQGFRLEKSRSRDERSIDYGTYQLVDNQTNTVVSHGLPGGYGLDLADVGEFLFEDVPVHVDLDGTLNFQATGGEPIIRYRVWDTSQLGARLGVQMEDGWVLYYIRKDGLVGEELLYNRDIDSVAEAKADAQEYVRRKLR